MLNALVEGGHGEVYPLLLFYTIIFSFLCFHRAASQSVQLPLPGLTVALCVEDITKARAKSHS